MKILGQYKNGNYQVSIFEDGTKIRQTDEDNFIPAFAENCDVKITDKCSVGCPFCYEGCIKEGKHAELDESLNTFINSLHPYTEMALNGNDLDWPAMENFLTVLKLKKVLANITVHSKQLIRNIKKLKEWQEHNLIHGIGVSVSEGHLAQTLTLINSYDLKNVVFHTIAGVTIPQIYEYLAAFHQKILVLGYKDLGRGVLYNENHSQELTDNMVWLNENLERLSKKCEVFSFDNLALNQLDVKSLLTPEEWEQFYMGDDGQYTFYIDLVKREYAKNSLDQRRFPMKDKTIDEMFEHVRTL